MSSQLSDWRLYQCLLRVHIGVPRVLVLLLVLLLALDQWFLVNTGSEVPDHLLQKTNFINTNFINTKSRIQRPVVEKAISDSGMMSLKKVAMVGPLDLAAVLQSTQSYQGTAPDGFYPVNEQGELVISIMIIRRFRYWLMASGELEDQDLLGIIQQDINQNLASPAKGQALELLMRYLGFLQSMQQQWAPSKGGQGIVFDLSPMERFQWVQAEHQRWFSSEEIEAFFSKEYRATQTQLALMAERKSVQEPKGISKPVGMIDNKDNPLKQHTLAKVDNSAGWFLAAQKSLLLLQQQANEKTYGATMNEATRQRLQTLINNRQQWLGRIERYQDYYKEWRRLGQSLERLKEYERKHFSEQEQRRLAAYR